MTTSHYFVSSSRRVRRSILAATILPAALACQAAAGLIEGASVVTLNNGSVLSPGSLSSFAGFADVTLNGGATLDATKSILTLTTDVGGQSRSAFTNTKYSVGDGFSASFVYKAMGAASPNGLGDGITFTVQNNAPTALGGAGGGLGYAGIANSAALELNIYLGAGQPIGTNFRANGATGVYIPSNPVNLASGHPIKVDVVYDAFFLTFVETLTDLTTAATYTDTFNVPPLSGFIGGDLAYVGFTGGTGSAQSFQTVENFVFNAPVPEPGSAILLLSGLSALVVRRGQRR